MRREQIANRQFTYILFIMRTTVIIATLPVLTAGDALQDAWISSLIVMVLTTLLVMFVAALGARFPQDSIVDIAEKLLGKWLGKALSLLILWAYLHLAAISIRHYAEMIVTGFMPETPLIFVIGGLVVVAAYAAYLGVEIIGRNADIFIFIMGFAVLVGTMAVIPEMRLANLEPVLGRGWSPVLEGTIIPVAVGAELLVIGMLVPSLTEPEKAVASAAWAGVLSGLVLAVIAFVVIAVMAAETAAHTVFPFLRVLRAIQVTEFIDRVEILVIFSWGLGVFVGFSTFIFAGARGLADVLGFDDYRFLVAPMAIHWTFLGQHLFQDMYQVREFWQVEFVGVYGLFLVLFPYGILWMAYLVRKGLRS